MKNKYPLVSVVMLNYNGLKYLKRTIPPILKLDYPNYEFIIVDNGSTDGSIEFISKFKKIKLIKSPKLREKNFACNYAVKKTKGEYILLLDNDVLIKNNMILKKLINYFLKLKDIGTIGLSFINEGESYMKGYGGYLGYYFIIDPKYISKENAKKINLYEVSFPHGFGFIIKKNIWEKLGGYDNFLKFGGDDSDIGIKIWMMGYKNLIFTENICIHIGMGERADNFKYSLKFKEMFFSNLYIIVKDYCIFHILSTLFFYSLYAFLKSVKQSIFRLNPRPFFAFFQGYYLFLINLPHAIKKRKEIQAKRVIKEDIFLKIKPPKFD